MLSPLRLAMIGLSALLLAFIVWASLTGALGPEFSAIFALPWGKVMLVDLYVGFILFAMVVALIERPMVTTAFIVALFVLGNVVAALWLAWRWPMLAVRMHRAT